MVENIIPASKYSYNASAKTITLLAEYATTVTAEQIKRIKNLTLKSVYFDTDQIFNGTITMTGAVISGFSGPSGAQNTDKLQIVYDAVSISTTGGGGAESYTIDSVNLFTAQTVAASGTATSTGVNVSNCGRVNVYCQNAGSTNLTLTLKGSNTVGLALERVLGVITLNATTVTKAGFSITKDCIPGYVWGVLTNADGTNAATVTVTVERYTSIYTATSANLFTSSALAASASATSPSVSVIGCRRVNLYAVNAGLSTSTTITIKGSNTAEMTFEKTIGSITIGAAEKAGFSIPSDDIPAYIFAYMKNNDAVNAATITITAERFT